MKGFGDKQREEEGLERLRGKKRMEVMGASG